MATVAPEASPKRAFNPCDRVYQVSQEFKPDKSKTWPYPAEEDGWFHAHNALRRELQMLEDCFEAVAARSMKTALLLEWEVECIKTIFEGHYEFIHEHHSNEDTKFTPVFSKRFRYPDKLTDDHEEIVKQLEAVCSRVRALRTGDSREVAIGSLMVDFKVYRTNLTAHLKEEEDIGIPLMRAYFDPKSIGKIVEEVMKSAPKIELGSFIYAMGPEKFRGTFMKQEGIPFFVWYLEFKTALQFYEDVIVSKADALMSGVEPVSKKRSGFLRRVAWFWP